MARYKLMSKYPEDTWQEEVCGQRKTTKQQIEQWCQDNIKACGLDWRVGFMIKFKGCDVVYEWQKISDGGAVRI